MRKNIKKPVSILLTLLLLLSAIAITPVSVGAVTVGGFEFNDGSIIGYSGLEGDITIPATYTNNGETVAVTTIGEEAFANCTGITSVIIPNAVDYIGAQAFKNCTNLVSVDLPDNLTSVSDSVFYNCTSLSNVAIPDSVTSIGYEAFKGCSSLPSVTIPPALTSIGKSAFEGCSSLPSVTIPSSVTTIHSSAFHDCSNLKSVYVDDLATWCSIDHNDYYVGSAFGIMHYDGISYDDQKNTYYDLYVGGQKVTNLVIPDYVANINPYAFSFCKSITNVTLHRNVESIGDGAFAGCPGITSFTIPDTVESVGSYAFNNCANLRSLSIGSGIDTVSRGMCSYSGLTSVTVPDNVTAIGREAFANCTGLSTASTGDGVTTIGDSAFAGCSILNNPTLGESVETIENYAFMNCMELRTLVIPDSVTTIGDYTLMFSPELTNLTINGNLHLKYNWNFTEGGIRNLTVTGTEIDDNVFDDVDLHNLYSLTISDTINTIDEEAFDSNLSYSVLTVKGDGRFDYENLPKTTVETLNVRGASVKDNVFSSMSNLENINFADSVKRIGDSSFSSCTSLRRLTIPNTVESAGTNAFAYCTALWNVTLSNSLSAISAGMFRGDTRLDNVTLPSSIESIGDNAFNTCTSLSAIEFHENIETIGDGAFRNCSSLEELTIPATVESIGISTFEDCENLETAYVWGRTTAVGNNAFHDCPDLTIYAYDSSPADTEALRDGDIPFIPILKTNLGSSYEDKPLTETQTVLSDGNNFGLSQSIYSNIEFLGTQLKTADTSKDIRFVSVINEGIVSEATIQHDIEDYGFVVAKCSKSKTVDAGETNIQRITIGAPNTQTFSCRRTSNKITGDYGVYNKATKYKYVTLAIDEVDPAQGFVVRFYIKTKSGRVYYSTYNTSYTGCVVNFNRIATIREGDDSVLFREEWEDIPIFSDN